MKNFNRSSSINLYHVEFVSLIREQYLLVSTMYHSPHVHNIIKGSQLDGGLFVVSPEAVSVHAHHMCRVIQCIERQTNKLTFLIQYKINREFFGKQSPELEVFILISSSSTHGSPEIIVMVSWT